MKGRQVRIPRINFTLSRAGVKISRIQFPLILAFALTVNRSQSKTFPHVQLDCSKQPFGHGQLYVAFSRATSSATLDFVDFSIALENIVYLELIQQII